MKRLLSWIAVMSMLSACGQSGDEHPSVDVEGKPPAQDGADEPGQLQALLPGNQKGVCSPPLSISLSPNPMTLYPGPGAAYTGQVINSNSGLSAAPWTIAAAVTQASCSPVLKTRWSASVQTTADGRNLATITLAPNSTDELAILQSGAKIILAIKYTGIAQPDFLSVGF